MAISVRRRAALVLTLVSTLGLASACGGADEAGGTDEIVIGAPLPLSGIGAAFGKPYLAAMQLTVDEINKAGGIKSLNGARLRIKAIDDASDATRDAQLIQQLATEDVAAFVGPLLSATVISSVPVINRVQRPFVGPNLDNAVTDSGSPWMFRVSNRADAWGDQAFEWLRRTADEQKADIRRLGIVGIDVPPGTSTTDVVEKRAKDLGWETVRINYDQKTTLDFAPIVARLRDANVDLVTGYQNPNDAVLFAKAVAQQRWRPANGFVWIAGGQYLDSFQKAVGDAAERWVVESYSPDLAKSKTPELKALADRFQRENGQPLHGLSGAAPAVITTLASAIEKAGSTDPAKIRDALRNLSFTSAKDAPFPYYSMAGGLKFDEKGDNTAWKGSMIQWRGGEQVTVAPAEIADGALEWPAHG